MQADPGAADEAAHQIKFPAPYRRPEPLRASLHGDLRLAETADFSPFATVHSLPLVLAEIGTAALSYPISFTGEAPRLPLAILGVQENVNPQIRGRSWLADRHVPLVARRYPFIAIPTPDDKNFVLCVDRSAPTLGTTSGRKLFEEGTPTELVSRALDFCVDVARQAQVAAGFGDALAAAGLLVERTVAVTLSDRRKVEVRGHWTIDVDTFAKLSDAVVADWFRRGWLGLAHAIVFSQQLWPRVAAQSFEIGEAA